MQLLFRSSTKLIGPDKTAYLSWAIASVFWVLGFMYVSQKNIDAYSSNLSRGVMLFLFNLPQILKDKTCHSPTSIKYMIIRHLILVLYGFIFAECFFYLPINVVHTIDSSGPVFVFAIDYFVNKIQISKKQMKGVIVAFIGVLLTVNGHILYQSFGKGNLDESEFKNYRPEAAKTSVQLLVSFLLFISNVGWGYSMVLVKQIKNTTHYHINFHHAYITIMVSGCVYSFTKASESIRLQNFMWSLLFQGLPLAIGNAFFANALKITKNHGITTMVGFIGVIIGYLVNVFRYGQQLNLICVFGSLFIMIGVSQVALKE